MITLSIALSEQCNLNCSYCNVDKLSKKKISPAIFLENFKKIRFQQPNEKIQIDFYGGEPLLHWNEIQEIISHTEQDEQVTYYMPTNGLLLNEERVDYLNSKKVKVSLSFDGLWQNENRKQLSGKETLAMYLEKVSIFKKIQNLKCHTMIYRGNSNLLENHLYILDTLGQNPHLTLIRDIDVWTFEEAEKVNLGFSVLMSWYKQNFSFVEMPNLIKEYLKHIILYSAKKIEIDFCGAGTTHLSFTENKIIPCNRFKDEDSISKIKQFKKMEKCQTCEVRKYCKKGCLYENIKNDGPVEEICLMYKHFYSEILKLIKEKKDHPKMKYILQELINDA